jgi:hypothetical protein
VAKAAFWALPDAEERKLGERTGLRYRSSSGEIPSKKLGYVLEHPSIRRYSSRFVIPMSL